MRLAQGSRAGSLRSSRGSADADAQRVGQAEQHYLRGHALRKQVRCGCGAEPWVQAGQLALPEGCPDPGCALRQCLHGQGQLEEAAREFSAALALEPGHFKALFNRAFVHDRVGPTSCSATAP